MKVEYSGRFRMIHGCISQDERITSRDVGQPEFFETIEAARESLASHDRFYRSIGYKIWFSNFYEWNPAKGKYEDMRAK